MIGSLFSRASARPLRIAYGRIFHEANAFSPERATVADFERMHLSEGEDLAARCSLRRSELMSFMPHAELTGFVQAARIAGGVTTVPTFSALAVPSGPLTRACFDHLVDRLIVRVRDALPLDGIYLALHGSMQVEDLDGAPEAHILRRVRSAIGESAKIAVSYDLHANFSEGLLADVVVAYRTNPHWDLAPTGYRAGSRLIRALRGEITPVHAWRKLPMVLGGGTTIDFVAPMRQVFRFMKRLEARPGIVSASLFMVHPYTNAETLGWAVHVCADGDQQLADASADELAEQAWQRRSVPMPDMYSVDAAIRAAADDPRRRLGPVTFVDVDDIVGAGAPGGNTRIVRALQEEANDLTAYVPVHDPRLIEELWSSSIERGTFTLRGTPGYDVPAVELDAAIACRTETEYGRVLRLDAGRIQVIVTERPPLPIHPRFWRQVGLRARDADIIVQKNFFHYRVFHVAHTFSHYPVSSEARGEGGATSFSHVRAYARAHGLFPATDPSEWRTFDRTVRSHNDAARA